MHPIPSGPITIDTKAYNTFVQETAIFQPNRGISYCISKMTGEVGEFCDKITRILAFQPGFTDHYFYTFMEDAVAHGAVLELGDICWYIAALAGELGYTFADVMERRANDPIPYQDGIVTITMALRLASYAGAIAERAGKIIRDEKGDGTNGNFKGHPSFARATMNDLGMMLELINELAVRMNVDLKTVLNRNVEKLTSRRERGKLSGSGDNR